MKGTNHSRLVWITDVLPHALAAEIRLRVERGAAVMKQTLEEEAARLRVRAARQTFALSARIASIGERNVLRYYC
jgi:hypothetical protein